MLADAWAWLDINSKQIGALSSIAFGFASAAVAWFAYRLNRRNNIGSQPMVFVTSWRIAPKSERETTMSMKVEFWNRRKYPVVLSSLEIGLRDLVFSGKSHEYSKGWSAKEGRVASEVGESVEPMGRKILEVEGPVALKNILKSQVSYRGEFALVRGRYIDPWEERAINVSSDGRVVRHLGRHMLTSRMKRMLRRARLID